MTNCSDAGRRLMKMQEEGMPFPGARPHLLISADLWDDRAWLNMLVRATFESLPPPKPPKPPKSPKPTQTAKPAKSGTRKSKNA
jgi:hypothetical protein